MASFLTRIKNAGAALIAKDETKIVPAGTGMVGRSVMELRTPWGRTHSRSSVFKDLDSMDTGDGLIARGLDIIASAACYFPKEDFWGFKIELVKDGAQDVGALQTEALALMQETADNTGLMEQTWNIIRMAVKAGNHFTELVPIGDDKLQPIARVKQFPYPWQIEVNTDSFGRLASGDPAAYIDSPQSAELPAYVQRDDIGTPVAAWYAYQIVHWQCGSNPGGRYAEPLLAPVISQWKRLQSQEDSLAIARLTRAWDTRIHKIPIPIGATQKDVEEKFKAYRENMEKDVITPYDSTNTRFSVNYNESPTDVDTDFYVSMIYTKDGKIIEGGVENLRSGTAALENINDISWSLNRVLAGLGVPMSYLNMRVGQRSFVDKTPEETKEAFTWLGSRAQQTHEKGARKIFGVQMLLSGIDPDKVQYKLIYPQIVSKTAEAVAKIAVNNSQAAAGLYKMNMPVEIIGKQILSLSDDDIAKWAANIVVEPPKATPTPNNGDDEA